MNKKWWFIAAAAAVLMVQCHIEMRDQGEQLYGIYCENCHGTKGEGLRQLIPPLAGADYLAEHQEELPCIIKNGLKGEITVNGQHYNQPMQPNPDLEPVEVANIINYINRAWGNNLGYVQHTVVEKWLTECGNP